MTVDLIVDTIDPVSAINLVFCEMTLAARWMHMVSPIVTAHTSGGIRFSVMKPVTGREMTARLDFALIQAIYSTAYPVWRRKISESDKFWAVVCVRMLDVCVCCVVSLLWWPLVSEER